MTQYAYSHTMFLSAHRRVEKQIKKEGINMENTLYELIELKRNLKLLMQQNTPKKDGYKQSLLNEYDSISHEIRMLALRNLYYRATRMFRGKNGK